MQFSLTRRFRALVDSLGSSNSKRGAAAATKAVPPSTHTPHLAINQPAHFEALENRTLLSTYYVAPWGNDSANGSSSQPWKSIAKINATSFRPGDQILFAAGQTFYGSFMLRSGVGDSATDPVVIGSYGNGRAIINSGGSDGLFDYEDNGISVQSLIFTGHAYGNYDQDGIKFESGGWNANITVNNCVISGYQNAGILVQGDNRGGFHNVRFTNNTIYNVADNGIYVLSGWNNANSNLYIGYNTISDIYGDGHMAVTGNGIVVGSTNVATVEHNTVYSCGLSGGDGNCGIWANASNDVLFQYNVVYNIQSPRAVDGDGFDFDADTSNSVMQYNYAYDNDGNGFQLNQWKNDNTFTNNTIRYNVSVNNGQRHSYAGLEVWGKVLNSTMYDNVVYVSPATRGGSPSGIKIHNSSIPNLFVNNLSFDNNVIVTTGGVPLVNVSDGELDGAKGLVFRGNDYWSSGAPTRFDYWSSYGSVASWAAATGQEKQDGKVVGSESYPAPVVNLKGATSSTSNVLSALSACKTLAGGILAIPQGSIGDAGSNVASNPLPSPPPTPTTTVDTSTTGWSGVDIGATPKAGGYSVDSTGTYTVSSYGGDIWSTADSLHYVYKSLTGNGQIVAQVYSLMNTNPFSKAGIMIRDNNNANSPEVSLLTTAHFVDTSMQTRATAGGSTAAKITTAVQHEWVKLIRSGNTITGYTSANGTTWTEIEQETVNLSATVEIGLAVSSHDPGHLESAWIENVAITHD